MSRQGLYLAAGRIARAEFTRKTRRAAAVQERFLRRFIGDFKETALGRDLNFGRLKDADDFRRRVPVLPYSHYEPYLDRIWNGEQRVMTPDPVIFLNATSGTTGPRKLTPVTRRSYHIRGRTQLISSGFFSDGLRRRGAIMGSVLFTNGAGILGRTDSGIPYGLTSACNLRLSRSLYRIVSPFPFPFDAFLIGDGVTRQYICLLFALVDPNLRIFMATFPAPALHVAATLDKHCDSLIADIEEGTLADWIDIPVPIRRKLERRWRANRARARELRYIVDRTGSLLPKDAWPELAAVVTARGGPSDFYFRKFPKFFGSTPIFGGVYQTTEAIYAICHEFDNDEAVLAVDAGYFEFVPETEWDKEHPTTLLPDEVDVGQEYRVLVTNHAGFCRYDIGDVVKILGRHEGAPTLTFMRRKGGQLSSVSEKTTEYHVDQTIRALQDQFQLLIEDYCVSLADEDVHPPYLVNIEPRAGRPMPDPEILIDEFDRILTELNFLYGVRRTEIIPPPKLRILAPGSFAALRARLSRDRGDDSIVKLQHITEDRNYLAGLTVLQEVVSTR